MNSILHINPKSSGISARERQQIIKLQRESLLQYWLCWVSSWSDGIPLLRVSTVHDMFDNRSFYFYFPLHSCVL